MNQHVRQAPARHRVVSREEWLEARKAHLKNEKALTRMRDMVSAERRELPWVKVEKNYVFDTPEGKKALAELFGEQQPAARLSLHVATGPGPGLQELLAWSTTSMAPTCIWRTTT